MLVTLLCKFLSFIVTIVPPTFNKANAKIIDNKDVAASPPMSPIHIISKTGWYNDFTNKSDNNTYPYPINISVRFFGTARILRRCKGDSLEAT